MGDCPTLPAAILRAAVGQIRAHAASVGGLTAAESAAAADRDVEEYLHLYLLNRGVLITPFHNMALMCPATTTAQVDRHSEAFGAAVKELFA